MGFKIDKKDLDTAIKKASEKTEYAESIRLENAGESVVIKGNWKTGMRTVTKDGDSYDLYDVTDATDTPLTLWLTKVLKEKVMLYEDGDILYIEYAGKTKGKKREYHDWKVSKI